MNFPYNPALRVSPATAVSAVPGALQRASEEVRRGGPEAASAASLGNLRNTYAGRSAERAKKANETRAKETSKADAKNARREDRMALQRGAAELTPSLRVKHCLWTPIGGSVDLVKRAGDARFVGVQTCGSVWSCPCCSARISEVRRQELHTLEEWAGSPKRGLRLVMMTLTARHRKRRLGDLVDRMAKAKRRMQNRKPWQRIRGAGLFGTVSVREATCGVKNGWHPHYHVLCLVRAKTDAEAEALLEPMRALWLDCLRKEGLTGTAERAFHLQSGDAVAAYITKHGRDDQDRKAAKESRPAWGIAEEMTLARSKRGRGQDEEQSRSPLQILRDAVAGDEASAKLWQEYALTMHGRRQQVWSDGLKLACGVTEIEDEEAAEGEAFSEDQDEIVFSWTAQEWRRIRYRRAELLAAAERGGADAVGRVLAAPEPETEVLEEEEAWRQWRPRPGGLAAAALVSVCAADTPSLAAKMRSPEICAQRRATGVVSASDAAARAASSRPRSAGPRGSARVAGSEDHEGLPTAGSGYGWK